MEQLSSWERLPHSPWKRGGGSAGGAVGWGSPRREIKGLSWARGRTPSFWEGGGSSPFEGAKNIFKIFFLSPAPLKIGVKFYTCVGPPSPPTFTHRLCLEDLNYSSRMHVEFCVPP